MKAKIIFSIGHRDLFSDKPFRVEKKKKQTICSWAHIKMGNRALCFRAGWSAKLLQDLLEVNNIHCHTLTIFKTIKSCC